MGETKIYSAMNTAKENLSAWYRSPLAQTVLLGLIFLLLFAAYTTIQFYAASTYGSTLAANSVSALYATFTCACFVAPSFVNKWGSRQTMAIGIGGYVIFVIVSLAYFHGLCGSWVVILAGILLGLGASLLWTAQGRLILQYAAIAEHLLIQDSMHISTVNRKDHNDNHSTNKTNAGGRQKSGMILGVFWAVFQCSSIVGGAVSFVYYTKTPEDSEEPRTGSTLLYIIFLAFMILSAAMTQLLLPPSSLLLVPEKEAKAKSNDEEDENKQDRATEETELLSFDKSNNNDPEIRKELEALAHDIQGEEESWREEARDTLLLFATNRPMKVLSILFLYTGFNQPYQQATFTRFFTKRAIGIELIVFHAMEIVGGVLCGRMLDHHKDSEDGSTRRVASICLGTFLLVNVVGNALAYMQESYLASVVVDIDSDWGVFLSPSFAFLCWGFADAQIQVYCYWLMGRIFDTHAENFSRAVAFYKCLQSLGYTIGFYLIPIDRLKALHQLGISSIVFILGTVLAFFQLPQQ